MSTAAWISGRRSSLVASAALTALIASAPSLGRAQASIDDTVAVCAVCHGESGEGNARLSVPRIGGMAPWYLARQLEYFRQGIRAATDEDVHGTQMRAMALTLEGEGILEDLAAHFAGLSPAPAPATIMGNASHGEELYTVCAACHMSDGEGSEQLDTPSLVGQYDWYTVRQIENYRQGIRGAHPEDEYGARMVPMVKTLMSHQDVLDLVAYINTL